MATSTLQNSITPYKPGDTLTVGDANNTAMLTAAMNGEKDVTVIIPLPRPYNKNVTGFLSSHA